MSLKQLSYLEQAKQFLKQAEEELRKGDYRQAAEKVWGAAALAIKAHALVKEGKRLASHGQLWEYELELRKRWGEWVHDAWMSASSMHVCFYEGWCKEEHVKDALKRVKELVKAIEKDLEN
ncbi:hypothetical protein IPA_07590 [Ignicoccus pacificus DSM 13166]|uniref:HEPN domain-containing protein n=1 Tax=Ignicoccus pacificus DSM 13166 TaxID=940294 RepID=A0A977PK89_9CREN|nr:hypothetical protein IPA_07590 [Ignicoccus pacificus DSM 13166]